MSTTARLLGCALAALVTGCGPAEPGGDGASATATAAAASRPAEASSEPTTGTASGTGEDNDDIGSTNDTGRIFDRDGKPVAVLPFDISTIPSTDHALGALPFFGLPQGYAPQNRPHTRAWARFPVRLGDGVHWVEGASWSARITTTRDSGKEFSTLELQRNLDNLITAAGGRKVFEGPLRRDIYYGPQLENEIGGGFIDVVNSSQDAPAAVYVVRQPQRNIWLQLTPGNGSAGLLVLEETPFKPTAQWSGSFPYLALPAGYRDRNKPRQRDFDRFPFWNGERFEQVEGRIWSNDFDKAEREYSMHEVRRNLEAMMASVNATKVFEGRIPRDQAAAVPQQVRTAYNQSAGFDWSDYDALVYRADLPDGRQVWVHARLHYLSAGWVVAEREGFRQTAALLPADALKKQLDAEGRVAIQVNFATDKATILPDSQPQLAQVLDMLGREPGLRLSVEGHTDNSGDATHNQRLSDARAAAVVASLVAAGTDAARLQARGWGQDKPVADNASEAGRASNRRVELVKR